MESKLSEYRARKRKEAFIQTTKDKIQQLVSFNATAKMNVDIPDDNTPLLPSPEDVIDRAHSPIASSDNESEDIGHEVNSLYAKFSKTSLLVMSFVLWVVVFLIFIQIEFGIIYLICSALLGIYFNTRTGPKPPDEISAYSVFNKNCESIDGTLKAEELEKAMVYGPAALMR